ncbi:hypothetical protein [Gordonia polyisoprenivorans]|uniref:hypothetical protein n=1 Tax=Gordonia polyisoprenivorans TaxID=84595 RepID=UPI001AD7E08B|nr:hypothetical protein [Gordonia polyisoprenivorans]QTI68177.1 hypothetical protein J6U32_22125 [Gordonia polyisoprenivorans]
MGPREARIQRLMARFVGSGSAAPAAPGAHGLVDSSRDPGIAGLRAALVDLVRSLAPGDTVTVRIHPLGRDPIGTIVVRTDDGARRLDYRANGEPEIRDRTEITD